MSTKDSILEELLSGSVISGESLAEKLGISRNSVWKAINQLRRDGYQIDAVTNRGYCLTGGENILSETAIRKALGPDCGTYRFDIHRTLDSTNTRAKALALENTCDSAVVIADSQSAGRGRVGRRFWAPPGTGLYISVMCRMDMDMNASPSVTTYAAVAVCRAIEKLCSGKVQIKWVNDLFMNGKKVCGILTEAGLNFETGRSEYIVVGIGVNVLGRTFPDDIAQVATSIEKSCGETVSRNQLAAEILRELGDIRQNVFDRTHMTEYRRRCFIIGRDITVIRGDMQYPAKALDIDPDGALVIQTADGIAHINSGEVSVRL